MGKYRALVDRALVGHFADIERRRVGEQNGAGDAARRAAARGDKRIEQTGERGHHSWVGKQSLGRSVRRKIGRELTAGVEIGKNQRRDFVAVRARHDHVPHQRGKMRNERGA